MRFLTKGLWKPSPHSIPPLIRVVSIRNLFGCEGVLDSELTNDVKKDIEKYWKSKINVPYPVQKDAEKFYLLSMFPYPSGNLHMGHVRVYTISDAIARYLRMNGKKVIHPIGWDAFGLPAENAAIERNIHPFEWTMKNINTMKDQLQELHISFDWDREISTCDPSYYKWTQHLFLLMFEQGLAYKKEALVNWDPVDETVLADEQVDENGCSWRSGCKVEKRKLSQWFLRTSQFSKGLYEGLNDPSLVDWRDATKIQRNWIGDPNGFVFHLQVTHQNKNLESDLTVWSDTPELLFGATFVSISPNHHFNSPAFGGNSESGDHQLDIFVVHPLTGQQLPVFVSEKLRHSPATDSSLGIPVSEYPTHVEFAIHHKINIVNVLDESSMSIINSQEFSGLSRESAKERILDRLRSCDIKFYQTSKKLRDWLISRQRYWGTPIPIINCPKCKAVPVNKKDLPVILPKLPKFEGKSSSLKGATQWIKVDCPKCGGAASRETDTMDTFVDSSWYFLRYLDSNHKSQLYDIDKINQLMPVDLYIGGKEHAGLHMFYARFVSHFLHSIGMTKHREPFIQLLMQGMVLGKSYRVKATGRYIPNDEVDFSKSPPVEKSSGISIVEDWEKMSKSKYNGIDPQKVMEEHGIDTTRLFILGGVAPQSPRKWNDDLFPGIKNFQWRLWLTVADFIAQKKLNNLTDILSKEDIQKHEIQITEARNYYTKGVTHNFINTGQLSVVISKLQGLTGELRRIPKPMAQTDSFERALACLLIMLAPMAPHFASELWSAFSSAAMLKNTFYDLSSPVLHQKWPGIDQDCRMQIFVKINGEECDSIPICRPDFLLIPPEKAISMALARPKVLDILQGAKVRHTRYKIWPHYDSEVHIIYTPPGKKAKKKLASAAL